MHTAATAPPPYPNVRWWLRSQLNKYSASLLPAPPPFNLRPWAFATGTNEMLRKLRLRLLPCLSAHNEILHQEILRVHTVGTGFRNCGNAWRWDVCDFAGFVTPPDTQLRYCNQDTQGLIRPPFDNTAFINKIHWKFRGALGRSQKKKMCVSHFDLFHAV